LSKTSIVIFFLSFSLTSYIDIIQAILELASEIYRFLCQENLTQLLVILLKIGILFAILT
jgi:hypothetical protein